MMLIRNDVVKLAVPILTEQVFVMSLGMINTMMAGHIGKEAVSAIGMVDSINNIFISFFSALAVGGTVVVAQYIGKKNNKSANESMKQVLYAGLILSLIITIIIWIFKGPLISLLYASAEKTVISNAFIYLEITLLTYPLITLDLIGNGIIRGSGNTKTPMKITIFMNLINVIMSYLFIYGINIKVNNYYLFLPGMGIKGAAVGIAIARTTGAFIILYVLLKGTSILKLTNLHKFKFKKELLIPIFNIGIPASVESLLFNGGKLITQIYIVSMGTVSIASNAITGSISNMLNIPGNALCTTAIVLVGQYMGKGKSEEAEKCLLYIIKVSTLFLFTIGAMSVPLTKVLVSLYTNNTDIIHLSSNLLKVNAVFIILWSVSFVLPSGLKGAGDAKYTMVTSIIGMWFFRITMGYVFGIILKFGLIGVWLGMYTDWVVRGILFYRRFRSGKWKNISVIGKTQEII